MIIKPNTKCIYSGGLFYKQKYGATWVLLYYHDYSKVSFWKTAAEALDYNEPDKYGNVRLISQHFKYNNEYEFLLEYPEVSGYNRWCQAKNPLDETKSGSAVNVTGYRPVHISWNTCQWSGLYKTSNDGSLIDGSYGINYGWFVIGRKSNYEGSVPGPCVLVNRTVLWMRVHSFYMCTLLKNRSNCAKISSFLLHVLLYS